jgi:RNA polymerase sigma-70 factor (ECF subfamily)
MAWIRSFFLDNVGRVGDNKGVLESRSTENFFGEVSEPIRTEANVDLLLVEKIKSGDTQAFDVLMKKYRERIFSVVYNMTSNREDAADLTQDVFIKAFRSIESFRGKCAFYTWLYRIALNTTITQLKKKRLRRFFSFESMDEEAVPEDVVNALVSKVTTDKSLFLKELQEKLNEALQSLSIEHRTAVVLFEIEGLSHQEIAEVMECSEGTVRSRLHYAKQQLQARLQNYIT